MKRDIFRFVMGISISLLVGCGALQEKNTGSYKQSKYDRKLDSIDSAQVKHKLYAQFNEWQGVRYKLGGLSQHGIDCSGFVHVTFKSKLGMHLPRTSHMQSKLGREVRKTELKAGDLVFFRTGPTSNHVGIYLEKNKFMHASYSSGVMISRLDDRYWRNYYWKSVRI